ncbi:MAG: ISL3 family transposase [Acidobacteriia bacterium]|nr:ISL3 family transposase [Terriglobia bacterium]
MRLETCIRKGLRLKAHRVREVREEAGHLVAEIERIEGRQLTCGRCSRRTRRVHSRRPRRRWRDLRVRDQTLVLAYSPCRVSCQACGPRIEHVPWADPWQRITRALSLALARLSRELSWKKTAMHYGVDWKTVAAAVKSAVERGLKLRPWKALRVIGIDEVSRSKGQRYLTLVYDLERSRLVWIGENRDADTMKRFFEWLGPRRARSIVIVCCDMWSVYLAAVREKLPRAIVVFDRFHVVQHLNRAVDDVRRESWRRLTGEEKSAFKRTRWLWLKNPWNLVREEKRRLSALCRRNQPIVRAYYLKEAFQRFWDYKRPGWAEPYLKQWLWWASHSRLQPFKKFARMIREHLDGILAWTQLRVSNGALEGMNNKVKVVSHRAYGYRTTQTYITAIWHGCGDLPLE